LGTYLENNSLAIWNFSFAIALDPSNWEAYYGRGMGYHLRAQVEPLRENRKQWQELAFNDLNRALELDQWQGLVRGERVSIYIETRQCDKALDELLSPYSSDIPLEDEIMYFIKTDRCLKDYSEAMRLINEQLGRSSDANLYWQRGLIYADQKEYEKALAELDTAAQEWSGWTGRMIPGTLWYNRAAIEYYRGNYDLVKEYILKGQPLTWIDWGSPYYFLGKVYLREGNTGLAIQAFLWAEQTLDEGEFLNATRNELYNLGALPEGVPTPTSAPEKATTLGTPENTPIPTEVSGQIMQAYGTMVFIQMNATLLDTAATRAQAGNMNDDQKAGFIHFTSNFFQEVESQIAQSVVPSVMDTDWKKALDIHDKTKDIYTRWINQDIEPTQVTVELAPLLSELAVSIQNTQKILSEEYGFDINELIQIQQDTSENVDKIFGP
jgi:tetratricopeptide (TPR) repeat protein